MGYLNEITVSSILLRYIDIIICTNTYSTNHNIEYKNYQYVHGMSITKLMDEPITALIDKDIEEVSHPNPLS
jgi:hypothetical protein